MPKSACLPARQDSAQMDTTSDFASPLVARRQAGLASLFLKISKFLLPGIQGLLFGVDLRLLLAAVFGKFGLVAQHGTRVCIVGGGAETPFALRYIEFTLQKGNLLLLLADLLLQLFALLLPLLGGVLFRWLSGVRSLGINGLSVSRFTFRGLGVGTLVISTFCVRIFYVGSFVVCFGARIRGSRGRRSAGLGVDGGPGGSVIIQSHGWCAGMFLGT